MSSFTFLSAVTTNDGVPCTLFQFLSIYAISTYLSMNFRILSFIALSSESANVSVQSTSFILSRSKSSLIIIRDS